MATPANRWLLDTTILVDLMRGSKLARDWIDSLPESALTISVITAQNSWQAAATAPNNASSSVNLISMKLPGWRRIFPRRRWNPTNASI
ncbi:MAG: hypothetical protein ABIH35_00460 [Patescibacteria group bacterium]